MHIIKQNAGSAFVCDLSGGLQILQLCTGKPGDIQRAGEGSGAEASYKCKSYRKAEEGEDINSFSGPW